MRGLFIGRFQPFHNGHMAIVRKMETECDVIMIGVGSAQDELRPENPLSGGERITMIRRTLESEGIHNFEIYPIPDINCYPAWPHYVRGILPSFDRIYANSGVVKRLFNSIRVEVVEVEPINRDVWRGTEIRRRIIDGEKWEDLVPNAVAEYLEEVNMKERIKPVYGFEEETEKKVAHLLTKNELTIATAESCTGGLIAHRLTNIPGSSAYFMTGLVTYSNPAKIQLLGVESETLEKHGAVSSEVAKEMAEGVKKRIKTDIGVSTTGIAGPGGGSEEKPVGTVHMGIATNDETLTKKFKFTGDRWQIKEQTSELALRWIAEILE